MSRQIHAKYCPRCHAMNDLDALECGYCGHQFSRKTTEAIPEEVKNRTQMFTLADLPFLAPRRSLRDLDPSILRPPSRISNWAAQIRHAPLLPAIVLLLVVTIAAIVAGYYLFF